VTADPLALPAEALAKGTGIGFTVVPDAEALSRAFAAQLLAEFVAAKAAGRPRVLFIVPVGPVGQFALLAERAMAQRLPLKDLTLLGMDEYLTPAGDWIAEDDPRSFRGHVRRHLLERLDPALAPRVVFPHPARLGEPAAEIVAHGGLDVCFGGVGICGHIAFNEPPEPGEVVSPEAFAERPTRVLRLARETRTINAVTVAGGALDLVPEQAVTVGMREILAARKIRLFMNRPWQRGILRKLLHGPVTAAVPASLIQRHRDAAVLVTEEVTRSPMPVLA
jgi:glucosamine-6-phosphate deaminase